ncbi:MAG: class I SAM-dependent methyltransferase [Deltaproteobacteria bacterium]|nr:class I SAM-dependent methyltransferase [Deltaproteobacteria bacterium]
MEPLTYDALTALEDPHFHQLFSEFIQLQRYDLAPYIHTFKTLDPAATPHRDILTVGGKKISAEALVSAYLEFIVDHFRKMSFDELCNRFQQKFHEAIRNGGPEECSIARASLDPSYEQNFIWPLLQSAVVRQSPNVILDYGCGQNGLSRVLQRNLRFPGKIGPFIFGVDLHDAQNAWQDEPNGIFYFDLKKHSLETAISKPVDLIVVNFVLHHMKATDRNDVLPKLTALLAPGGTLVVTEASVETDNVDRTRFAQTAACHPAWNGGQWKERYIQWSEKFLDANAHWQHYLLRLEDLFGHCFLYPQEINRPPMPMPFSFIGRDSLTDQLSHLQMRYIEGDSQVYGLPPVLKYGPPTSLWVFRKEE